MRSSTRSQRKAKSPRLSTSSVVTTCITALLRTSAPSAPKFHRWQWDDHEVTNNWSPSKVLDSRYTNVTDIATLVANGTRAFQEYAPIRFGRGDDNGRVYRKIAYGADLDLFVL